MKIFCVVFWLLVTFFGFSNPVDVQCRYETFTWTYIGDTYNCITQNNLNINSRESTIINLAVGNHEIDYNNDNVHGFYADDKKLQFIPQNLEKVFKNLKLIYIKDGRIKEITQDDLKPFPKLKFLSLYQNDIEVLQQDLFAHNQLLGYIAFSLNKIKEIHPNIFDNLNNLVYLRLDSNTCIDMEARNNPTGVKEIIRNIKMKCKPKQILHEIVDKNAENLSLSLENDLKSCKNPILELSQKISTFKEATRAANMETLNKIENIERNMKNVDEKLSDAVEKLENMERVNEEKFRNFQNEIFANFDKILKKIEEIGENLSSKIQYFSEKNI